MTIYDIEPNQITDTNDLNDLIDAVKHRRSFVGAFKFKDSTFSEDFIVSIGLDPSEFEKKSFFYDKSRNLHVARSSDGNLWVSTIGLITKRLKKGEAEKYYNSCIYQYHTLSFLLDKVIGLCQEPSIYDINSQNYNYMCELAPALFHNIVFYIEIFFKTYMILNGEKPANDHKLSHIIKAVKVVMFKKNQNDTIFHANILHAFEIIVDYICSIPNDFKEQNIRYDDNSNDDTVVRLDYEKLINMRDIINISLDFIENFYDVKAQSPLLQQGLFDRLVSKTLIDDKQRIYNEYGFLRDKS